MTTKQSGGRITGLLALTFEAQVAMQRNDPVMVTGDYEVGIADGTKPVVGFVSVSNVKRTSTEAAQTGPVPNVPGDVTVEARGLMVLELQSGAAIAAGAPVGINATGDLVAVADAGVLGYVGIALTATTAANQAIDVLVG